MHIQGDGTFIILNGNIKAHLARRTVKHPKATLEAILPAGTVRTG